MVPVPEELVDQVKKYMTWKLNRPKVAANPDAVRIVYDEIDTEMRRLVRYTAEVTDQGDTPTLTQVAEACDMNPREVVGSLTELSALLQASGRAEPLILPRVDVGPRPDGVTEWAHRVLEMTEADARLILGF